MRPTSKPYVPDREGALGEGSGLGKGISEPHLYQRALGKGRGREAQERQCGQSVV